MYFVSESEISEHDQTSEMKKTSSRVLSQTKNLAIYVKESKDGMAGHVHVNNKMLSRDSWRRIFGHKSKPIGLSKYNAYSHSVCKSTVCKMRRLLSATKQIRNNSSSPTVPQIINPQDTFSDDDSTVLDVDSIDDSTCAGFIEKWTDADYSGGPFLDNEDAPSKADFVKYAAAEEEANAVDLSGLLSGPDAAESDPFFLDWPAW